MHHDLGALGAADRADIRADGNDLSFITVRAEDQAGRIQIAASGDGPKPGETVVTTTARTFNKMLEYTMGIFADMFCLFRHSLSALDRLVVSGYSCRDKGVNAAIAEWTRASPRRRILVIDPHATQFSVSARGAIRKLLTDCRCQIELRDAEFGALPWDEIRRWALAPSDDLALS